MSEHPSWERAELQRQVRDELERKKARRIAAGYCDEDINRAQYKAWVHDLFEGTEVYFDPNAPDWRTPDQSTLSSFCR